MEEAFEKWWGKVSHFLHISSTEKLIRAAYKAGWEDRGEVAPVVSEYWKDTKYCEVCNLRAPLCSCVDR